MQLSWDIAIISEAGKPGSVLTNPHLLLLCNYDSSFPLLHLNCGFAFPAPLLESSGHLFGQYCEIKGTVLG